MFRCGVGTRCITPQGPVHLMGYAARWGKATDGSVHDPLFAKALYLENKGESAILLSADLCELGCQDALEVREQIREKTGVRHAIVAVTHTHSAPNTAPQPDDEGGFDAKWLNETKRLMVQAAVEAVENTFDANLSTARIAVPEVGKNRRSGRVVTDPEMTLILVQDDHQATRALVCNYACHCTVLDGNSYTVSADYPAYLYQFFQEKYPDADLLFFNGAAGDINIGYSSDASALGEPMDIRTFAVAQEKAKLLFSRAMEALSQTLPVRDGTFFVKEINVAYPLKQNAPTPKALEADIEKYQSMIDGNACDAEKREAKIQKIYCQCLRSTIALVGCGREKSAETTLLRVLDTLLISVPVELFCEVGLELKALMPQNVHAAVIGYANGYIGYLPTAEILRLGGYEAETSMFAPEAGYALVNAVRKAI